MKHLITFFACIFICLSTRAQGILHKNYAFKSNVDVTQVQVDGTPTIIPYIAQTQVGDLFTLIGLSKDKQHYVIQFLPFSELNQNQKSARTAKEDAERSKQNALIQQYTSATIGTLIRQSQALAMFVPADLALKPLIYPSEPFPVSHPPFTDDRVNKQYFLLSIEDFTNNATDDFNYKRSFLVLSSLVLPYKLNFGNKQPGSGFSFAHNITIGPAFGCRFRTSKTSIGNQALDLLLNIGITSINVDQKTLPGVVTESTNVSAFTVGGGIAYEFGKIQLGLFTGIDILTGDSNHAYVYRNSPYLSLGIGFQIFSMKTAGASQ